MEREPREPSLRGRRVRREEPVRLVEIGEEQLLGRGHREPQRQVVRCLGARPARAVPRRQPVGILAPRAAHEPNSQRRQDRVAGESLSVPTQPRPADRTFQAGRGLAGAFQAATHPEARHDQAHALEAQSPLPAVGTPVHRATVRLEQHAHLPPPAEEPRSGIDAVVRIVELATRVVPAVDQAAGSQQRHPARYPLEEVGFPQGSLDLGAERAHHADAALGARLIVQLERQAEDIHALRRGGCVDVRVGCQCESQTALRSLAGPAELDEALHVEHDLGRHVRAEHPQEVLFRSPAIVAEQVLD